MAKDAAERKAAERLNRSHRPWSYQADLALHLGRAVMMHWEELPEEVRTTLKEAAAGAMHRQVTKQLGRPLRIPTKSATYSDLKSVHGSDFKAVHYSGRFRPAG